MIWFTSDQHFSHARILTFTDSKTNELIRPGFKNVEEMDELMIQRWNERVKPTDKIYHLGDFAMGRDTPARIVPRLNGHKRLLVGNHDNIIEQRLYEHFEKILVWRIFKKEGFICTHVPIMEHSFRHKVKLNAHGHEHQNAEVDNQHMNICVENTDYYPISMDEIIQEIKNRQL